MLRDPSLNILNLLRALHVSPFRY